MPSGYSFTPIEDAYAAPPDGSKLSIVEVYDVMADMERSVLGFLDPGYGLAYSYGGTNLPEKLPENIYPVVLHVPVRAGKMQSLTTMGGNALVAHPGGTRFHTHPFEIYWLVGNRAEEAKRLMVKSQFWLRAVDMAYAANGTLGGAVKGVELRTFTWGDIAWAGQGPFFGWIFTGEVTMRYTMRGGG